MSGSRVQRVTGRALPLRGHDIDTDRIIPARFLKAVSFEGLERGLFIDDRAAGGHPFDDPAYAGAAILLVNRNFGCGSSREHAPQALQRWGIRAIVGESYSEIFFSNSLTLGLPCVSVDAASIERLMVQVEAVPDSVVTVDLVAMQVIAGAAAGSTPGLTTVPARMPDGARDALTSGLWDGTGLLLEDFDEVRATADRLPYVTGRW